MKRLTKIILLLLVTCHLSLVTSARADQLLNEAVTATKVQVSANPCRVYSYKIVNRDATNPVFVHLYDALSANVTVGTTTQSDLIPVPANGAVLVPVSGNPQFVFSTGLTIAITTSPLSTGTTAPGTAAVVSINYQQ